jgi:cholesterol transport system auxiliary component
MKRWLRFATIGACCFLGACAAALNLAAPEPPKLYSLTPKSTFVDDLPDVDARVSVETPTATAGLNTARIAVQPTSTTLEYYAGGRWVDVVPIMVQNLFRESLDNAGKLDVLGREVVGVRADYALLLHIREFQAEYDESEQPIVRVRIQARLLRLPRRTSIAATSKAYTIRAADGSLPAVVSAFDDGLGKAMRRLVEWAVREIDEAERTAAVSAR